MASFVCAVDVGTTSARAGVFAPDGRMLGRAACPIETHQPAPGRFEHDSEEIWRAACVAVREAVREADVDPAAIVGLAFDATTSLTVRDADGGQVAVSPGGETRWDTISWQDHRAIAEAADATATGHPRLAVFGGSMPAEMQPPKLMWLKRHNEGAWQAGHLLLDLADLMAWRATGNVHRSRCPATAKWGFAGETGRWPEDFYAVLGLDDVLRRAGFDNVVPVGADVGCLTAEAAEATGLTTACRVGAGMIDAFAGALGVTGGYAADELPRHAALIGGTSSCVMAHAREMTTAPAIWGPCRGAVAPDVWMAEGGQSASGALLEYVVETFGRHAGDHLPTHGEIIARIAALRAAGDPLAPDLHVLPDFRGNRTPLGDNTARGAFVGLDLDATFDGLCRVYWRTALALALSIRQIMRHMREAGYAPERLHIAGGHARNPLLVELYADVADCTVVESESEDAVLAGTAMAASVAAGLHADLAAAGRAMMRPGHVRQPDPGRRAAYERDYRALLLLQRQQAELAAL